MRCACYTYYQYLGLMLHVRLKLKCDRKVCMLFSFIREPLVRQVGAYPAFRSLVLLVYVAAASRYVQMVSFTTEVTLVVVWLTQLFSFLQKVVFVITI